MTVSIDWTDVAVHAVIGTGVGVVAAVVPWDWYGVLLVICNPIVWHVREVFQRIKKGQPYSHCWTSSQVLLEWIVPSVTCVIAFAVLKFVIV